MSPYSSAPQLQNTMVLLGRQPREKIAIHNVLMYPEIFLYVNGHLRTIEFPEYVHFVRSNFCLQVQYRFENGVHLGIRTSLQVADMKKTKPCLIREIRTLDTSVMMAVPPIGSTAPTDQASL